MTALVVASSGTAVAASSLVNGDKLIKKHSLSGNRLRNHTITGTQVNLNKLGKVPSAKNADHATTAGSATSATTATTAVTAGTATNATNATNAANATNATNATTAANVANVTHFIKSIAPAGSTVATGATVTLGTSGPLTIEGICYTSSGSITAGTYLTSSVTGYFNSYDSNSDQKLAVNTPVDVGEDDASGVAGTPDWEDPYDGTFSAITGTLSNYITGLVSNGVNLTSANECTFAGFTSAS